jgi:RNA polymerase sigma factor (sigma-70 family)
MLGTPSALRSDERLALQVAGGNDAAFAVIYRRYEATLFGYCRSITRDTADADDALQNAMLKALLALRRSERSAPLRPWLFRIVHNEAINVLRRRPAVEPPGSGAERAHAAGADEQAVAREAVAEVVHDLRELPLRQRAALVMRELSDLDYDEIALALDVTENNARQLVFAARANLKERQEGRGMACETVRDLVLYADGRKLRRRPVRAHLRVCASCRSFAEDDPRVPKPAAAGATPWWPLAGGGFIDGLLRALGLSGGGGATLASGGSSLVGSAVVKTVAATAIATAGFGVADTLREPADPSTATAEAATAPEASPGRASTPATTQPTVVHAAATPARSVAAAPSASAQSSQSPPVGDPEPGSRSDDSSRHDRESRRPDHRQHGARDGGADGHRAAAGTFEARPQRPPEAEGSGEPHALDGPTGRTSASDSQPPLSRP